MTVRDKALAIPDIEALEARLYFKSFYGEENLSLRTQLDITQFDKIYLPVQDRNLLHPYSDSEACATTIKCHKLEEVLASKLTTLLHRRNPVDLFDLLYAIVFRDQFGVSRREVVTTFLKKSIFEANPTDARDQLRAVPIADCRGSGHPSWPRLQASSILILWQPISRDLSSSLFALVIIPQPAFAGGAVPAARILRPSGGIVRPIGGGFPKLFSFGYPKHDHKRWSVRNNGTAPVRWLRPPNRAIQA